MTESETQQAERIADLEKELAAAYKLSNNNELRFKVGPKGGLCVFGLNGRYPTTLYKDQWIRLLDSADLIRAQLATMPDRKPAAAKE